jgi:hypothetical protein
MSSPAFTFTFLVNKGGQITTPAFTTNVTDGQILAQSLLVSADMNTKANDSTSNTILGQLQVVKNSYSGAASDDVFGSWQYTAFITNNNVALGQGTINFTIPYATANSNTGIYWPTQSGTLANRNPTEILEGATFQTTGASAGLYTGGVATTYYGYVTGGTGVYKNVSGTVTKVVDATVNRTYYITGYLN